MADGDTAWRTALNTGASSITPTFSDKGKLITSDRNGTVYRIKPEDGTIETSANIGSSNYSGIIRDRNGDFYTHTGSDLVKFDVDLNVIWRTGLDGGSSDPEPVYNADEGRVYIYTPSATMYALNTDDGSVAWTYSYSVNTNSHAGAIAINRQGHLFWVTDKPAQIICLNPDGTQRFHYTTSSDYYGSDADPVVYDDDTFVVALNFDGGTGAAQLRHYDLSGSLVNQKDAPSGFEESNSSMNLTSDEDLYWIVNDNDVSPSDGQLLKLDSNLNTIWSFTAMGKENSGVLVDEDNAAYFAEAEQQVARKITSSGSQAWSTSMPGYAADDRFVSDSDRIITHIDNEVVALENKKAPVRGWEVAVDLPWFRMNSHSINSILGTRRCIMLKEQLGLRGVPASQGDDAVLYRKDAARGDLSRRVGDEVVLVADDIAQG